ncbi:hypothetical protein [Flavobacterium sp.]|uniref:hypothetical protein n=1 Tax=Flavobacterium sp. TaxID=239 RepID=UPI003C48CBB4
MFNENEIKNLDLDYRLIRILILFNKAFKCISIFVFLIILFLPFYPIDFAEESEKNFRESQYSGIVIKSYIDYANHAAPTIVFSNHSKEEISPKFFSNVSVGDSVVKIKGKLTVKIYKVDGKLAIYDYLKDNEDVKH